MGSQMVVGLFPIPLLSLDLNVEMLSLFLLVDTYRSFPSVLLKNPSYHQIILLLFSIASTLLS